MLVDRKSLWFVAAVAATALGACARDPYVSTANTAPSGNWRIERQIDRITGAPISSALLTTRNSSNSAAPYPKPATLQLTCFGKQPIVRFAFEFKVGSERTSLLGYRFDEKPGREISARFLQDDKSVVIDDKAAVVQFASDLISSQDLYVRIRSLKDGRSTADFKVDGSQGAIEAGFAGCPLSGTPRAG